MIPAGGSVARGRTCMRRKEFDRLPLANSRQGAFWKEGTAEGSWIDHSPIIIIIIPIPSLPPSPLYPCT